MLAIIFLVFQRGLKFIGACNTSGYYERQRKCHLSKMRNAKLRERENKTDEAKSAAPTLVSHSMFFLLAMNLCFCVSGAKCKSLMNMGRSNLSFAA